MVGFGSGKVCLTCLNQPTVPKFQCPKEDKMKNFRSIVYLVLTAILFKMAAWAIFQSTVSVATGSCWLSPNPQGWESFCLWARIFYDLAGSTFVVLLWIGLGTLLTRQYLKNGVWIKVLSVIAAVGIYAAIFFSTLYPFLVWNREIGKWVFLGIVVLFLIASRNQKGIIAAVKYLTEPA